MTNAAIGAGEDSDHYWSMGELGAHLATRGLAPAGWVSSTLKPFVKQARSPRVPAFSGGPPCSTRGSVWKRRAACSEMTAPRAAGRR